MCADSVEATQLSFQITMGGAIPTSALHLKFQEIRVQTACDLNAKWHSRFPKIDWSNVVRNKYYICYGAFYDQQCHAVAIWSSPIAANRLKDGQALLELRRMAISDECPRNTASRMLGWMRKDIQRRFPDIVRLISYQDTEVHEGTIYKAAGWRLAEKSGSAQDWTTSKRKRSEAQSSAVKVRWEYDLERGQNGNNQISAT
jgi:hypothetical protein